MPLTAQFARIPLQTLALRLSTACYRYLTSSPSKSLPQPIPQLRLPKLRQIIHALLTQINALQLRHILRRRLADSLHNNRRVGLEDNAIVDDLVNSEGDEVVVLDDCAAIY